MHPPTDNNKSHAAWLKELGFDAVINYKTQSVPEALKAACPKGIDLVFENVGGKMHDDILGQVNTYGRVALCGLIAKFLSLGVS